LEHKTLLINLILRAAALGLKVTGLRQRSKARVEAVTAGESGVGAARSESTRSSEAALRC
jgi:hypothetical protein